MLLYKDSLFKDYNTFEIITDEVKKQNDDRIFTGGVRINSGNYRTAEEDKEYREKSLSRILP